mgnify:CR=1 FL=1
MYILGLSYGYHDSSAALIKDGQVIFAAQEERYSRIKHDSQFPNQSISRALKFEKIEIKDIDYIIYYESSLEKFNRIKNSIIKNAFKNFSLSSFKDLINTSIDWVENKKFIPEAEISKKLNYDISKIKSCSHHESHAASSFYNSNFENAAIITIDGVGEKETITVSHGKKGKINKICSHKYPHSLGLFYSTITSFLGFEINEGEYKVMGLAAFGKPIYADKVKKLISYENNKLKLNMMYFNFDFLEQPPYNKNFVNLFGDAAILDELNGKDVEKTDKFRYFADLASSFQSVLEDIIFSIFEHASSLTKENNICYSGGVALNAVANGKLIKSNKYKLYIYPAAGDAGCAVGAAQFYYFNILNKEKKLYYVPTMYLGDSYLESDILKHLNFFNLDNYKKFNDNKELSDYIANKLNENKVVGWFNGRSEFGPRSLGARSILASPKEKNMKNIINEKIKFREKFRPFAPLVLEEIASEYFDYTVSKNLYHPENFMLSVCAVKKEKVQEIYSATNVDFTSRIQLISKENKEQLDLRCLLENFYKISGLPVLINTSFNRRGEPIVESPKDAIKVFLYTDIDILVLNNHVLIK